MEKGETRATGMMRVPDYLVRNGFWYKVAGGDAETPEYRVTVRTLPLFTEYYVTYDYPAYTRLKPDMARDSRIRALRGTRVTLVGKTNRTVKDGRLVFDPPTRDPIAGKVHRRQTRQHPVLVHAHNERPVSAHVHFDRRRTEPRAAAVHDHGR